jgi:2-dehydro-3-deoxygluconokinase
VVRLGKDQYGEFCLENLRSFGVDTTQVKCDNKLKTGVSIVLLKEDGGRACVTYLGSNANLSANDIDINFIKNAKAVHISNCYFLTSLLGKPLQSVITELKNINPNVIISLDPGPIPIHFDITQVYSILLDIECVDFFFPILDEARVITGEEDPYSAVKTLLQYGPDVVILKMGEKGCLLANKDGISHIPSFNAGNSFIDTAGAGDVFAAACLFGLIRGFSITEATSLAIIAAGLKVSKKGREGYPTWNQIRQSYRNRKK